MIIIIPIFNPTDLLVHTLDDIFQNKFLQKLKVILVNDGSIINVNVFQELETKYPQLIVLHHKKNRGKGAALKTAIEFCLREFDFQYFITADGDGQHLAEDICRLAQYQKNSDLLLGVRDLNFSKTPLRSFLGNRITSIIFWMMTGFWFSDSQTGLRRYSKSLGRQILEFKSDRYDFETEVLLYATANKVLIESIVIETVYILKNKSSHFHFFNDSRRIVSVFLENILNKFNKTS